MCEFITASWVVRNSILSKLISDPLFLYSTSDFLSTKIRSYSSRAFTAWQFSKLSVYKCG